MYRPLFARSRLSVALGSALVLVAAAPAMAQQAATQEQEAEPASSKTPVQLDRMTVTGSRIYRAGFDTLEPAAVVSRESIENYGDLHVPDNGAKRWRISIFASWFHWRSASRWASWA